MNILHLHSQTPKAYLLYNCNGGNTELLTLQSRELRWLLFSDIQRPFKNILALFTKRGAALN